MNAERDIPRGQAQPALAPLPHPYLLFLGDTTEAGFAKTAFGLRDWAGDKCIGELMLPGGTVSTGLPKLSLKEAKAQGARSLVIGVANSGGVIAENWLATLVEAVRLGFTIVSGMHMRLRNVPGLAALAAPGQLIDIREPPPNLSVATGAKRSGKRLLTVGTDCALGKKYAALSIHRELQRRGIHADFRATGQTGIMIAGSGIAIDAVIADFAAGAAEMLSPAAAPDHWDVIEGQGSLFHPAYAGVSVALLHGSQPDVIVVCHEVGRTEILGNPGYRIPTVEDAIALNLRLGSLTNRAIRCGGVSLNTGKLDAAAAEALLEVEGKRLGLPVADPIRGGERFARLVDNCLS
jgi:uncharacterized NAD-dependent epimerase/dehydratase family protein